MMIKAHYSDHSLCMNALEYVLLGLDAKFAKLGSVNGTPIMYDPDGDHGSFTVNPELAAQLVVEGYEFPALDPSDGLLAR